MPTNVLNYIDGRWVESATGQQGENVNPATGEVIGTFELSDQRDVDRAVQAAQRAQAKWAATPAPVRGRMVFEAWRLMEERAEEMAVALSTEEGKILPEARGELKKSAILLEFLAGEGRRLRGDTVPSEISNVFSYTVRQPLGVVGLITPWNFPVAIASWKIAPAVVSGNTVVFKPAEQTPWTGKLIVELFHDAGFPPGVVNMVTGLGEPAGAPLVRHKGVKAISFTGSTQVGRWIYAEGARLQKKVQCEMGGKNPVIVMPDADLDAAIAAVGQGAFGATGQRCTATSRAIVMREVYDDFLEGVVERAKAMRPGHFRDEGVTMGPCIDERQLQKVLRYVEIGRGEGARCVFGGTRMAEPPLDKGFFPAPTVFADVEPQMRLAQEEIFGPVLSVIPVDSLDQAIDVANSVDFGLSASIFTNNARAVFHFVNRIESGMVHVNAGTIGGEAQLPFGGVKATGIGDREMGRTAVEFFTELKTVYVNYGAGGKKASIY